MSFLPDFVKGFPFASNIDLCTVGIVGCSLVDLKNFDISWCGNNGNYGKAF